MSEKKFLELTKMKVVKIFIYANGKNGHEIFSKLPLNRGEGGLN